VNEAARIVVEPYAVDARLRELQLVRSDLTDPLLAGASAMALSYNTNHPPMFGGLNFWAEAVRVIRDRKMAEGWTKSDAKNYATVISPTRSMQIAIARGDEYTGVEQVPDGKPSTQYRKGTATQQAVILNGQLSLFDELPAYNADMPEGAIVTWVLLHFRRNNVIHCELSHPTVINKSGFVEGWAERIIIGTIDLNPKGIALPDEPPIAPDVFVRRRG
jgi:hypothetical protein